MADNVQLNENATSGAICASAEMAFSGDTAKFQIVAHTILSGSEGSWSQSIIVGGAGAVTAGTQRVTLASDDPSVALLGTIDADTSAIATDLAALEVLATAGNALLTTMDADTGNIATSAASIDGKITACNTGAVTVTSAPTTAVTGTFWPATQPVSGTVTANLSATDNAVLDAIATSTAAGATEATLANVAGYLDTEIAAIVTAAQILDNIVSGSEAQVDVVAPLPAGTNAIGKLAANSGVDIGDVDVTSIAAGTDTIGGVIAQQSSSVAYDGTTACTIKRASGLAAGGVGATDTLVAAVAGKKIRVLALGLFATSATTNSVFLDNGDNELLFGSAGSLAMSLDADGDTVAGFVLPFNPGGWLETDTANEAIELNSSAAQDIAWTMTYIEVA